MTRIRLDDVSKAFAGGHVAVRHVDLVVDDGEFHVLLGPSGCGKSTVLRMIAGLERPSAGEILLDEVPSNDIGARDRDIAMAFQEHALYPQMTVAENLGFPLVVTGVKQAEVAQRVDRTAHLLRLVDVLDRTPNRLSGGQRQRVSLGRSIIRNPRLFLMDEPLSNLDAHLRLEARSEILRLQRRLGTTTVFVTHDQSEAMALGDRITIMLDGKVVQTGTPTELYDDPADLFVALFLGSPRMNVVKGSVTCDGAGTALRLGSQLVRIGDGPAANVAAWAELAEREVAVGFRPEAMRPTPGGDLISSVESVEPIGHEQLVHTVIDAPSVDITANGVRVSGERSSVITTTIAAHDPVSLWEPFTARLDGGAIHLFDLDSGRSLRGVASASASPIRRD